MKQIYIAFFAGLCVLLGGCAQDETSDAGVGTVAEVTADAPPAPATPLAAGNAKAGKRLYIYCQACHSLESGGMNKVGPNLYGFIGKPAGEAEGFVYSAALIEANLTWTDATLDEWIASPSSLVPGTTMVFAGIQDAQQRADLIAYLKETTDQ